MIGDVIKGVIAGIVGFIMLVFGWFIFGFNTITQITGGLMMFFGIVLIYYAKKILK